MVSSSVVFIIVGGIEVSHGLIVEMIRVVDLHLQFSLNLRLLVEEFLLLEVSGLA